MKRDEDPEIIDLNRYKAEHAKAQARLKEQAAAKVKPPAGAREPFLGSRPQSGLILVLILLALAALYFGPLAIQTLLRAG